MNWHLVGNKYSMRNFHIHRNKNQQIPKQLQMHALRTLQPLLKTSKKRERKETKTKQKTKNTTRMQANTVLQE